MSNELYIKNLKGKTIMVTFDDASKETVYKIKEKISQTENIAPALQRLLYMGQQLSDPIYLSQYSLKHGKCLNLVYDTDYSNS